MDLPKDLQEFASRTYCPRCMTPNGRGFSVHAAPGAEPRMWTLVGKCLRCGFTAIAHFQSSEEPPAPIAPEMGVADAITTDEVIDLHEALKSENWLAQLTGRKA